ncbi:MAG: prepilin-type N-terminal cleavage/methylation domain-containing protein [Verrucomicrobiota bacterium]
MTAFRHRIVGFSLIELLCSMAIGSILLFAAAMVLVSYGIGYARINGEAASGREARAMLTQLAADLSSALFCGNGVLETSAARWPISRLGFLSLQPGQAQSAAGRIGDLCAVCYYVQDLSLNSKTVRCLLRGYRESQDTFHALEAGEVGSLFAARSLLDEPVAFGVVSFGVSPLSRDPAGRWIAWVANDQIGPEALEVRLVLARRDLAGNLSSPEDWDGAGTSGKLLGEPAEAERNPGLDVYQTLIRYGNHDHPHSSSP